MTCPRCSSERLFTFEPASNLPAKPQQLPVVCRNCGLITIAGVAVTFPPELEAQAKSMAEAAAAAGEQAAKDLAADPDQPIAAYFARVYRNAYLDGFWRAFTFARHEAKEGRLRRLRQLWQAFAVIEERRASWKINPKVPGESLPTPAQMTLLVPTEAYDEFKQLLELGDASRSTDQDPPVSDRPA